MLSKKKKKKKIDQKLYYVDGPGIWPVRYLPSMNIVILFASIPITNIDLSLKYDITLINGVTSPLCGSK